MAAQTSLTEQLQRYFEGDLEMAESVLQTVLPKLHDIAERELRRERRWTNLSPTELIHEVWMKNMSKGGWEITSRQHFYALASLAMRHILVDFARARLALRRGKGILPEPFDKAAFNQYAENTDLESIVRIGQLMDQLTSVDPRAARMVDMHYFVGFTFDEISEHTGMTVRQVRHSWEKGRNWLKRHM